MLQNIDNKSISLLKNLPAEDIWLANFTSKNTQSTYKNAVFEFINFAWIQNTQELYQMGQAEIIAYRTVLKKNGLSNTTIAVRLSALSSLYKFLADKQLCPTNPVSGVKRPNTGTGGLWSGKTPTLSSQDVRKVLDSPDTTTIQGRRDLAILHVYFYLWTRCNEPASLRVKDFYIDRGYPVLKFTIKWDKTNIVAIHVECQIAIDAYLSTALHKNDPSSPLFRVIKTGRNFWAPISRKQFYNVFKKYIRLAGLPNNITPHSARATFITEAFEAWIPWEDIQRTAGHASITTTEWYNHSAQKLRKSASFGVNY